MFSGSRGILPAICCALLLSWCAMAQSPDSSPNTNARPEVHISEVSTSQLPDSPGSQWAKLQLQNPQEQDSTQNQSPAQTSSQNQQDAQAPAANQGNGQRQRPTGTAAAEAPKVTGITAAQPAGVAIAPAKQRRVRTIVLKVGAIIGAGAAVGTVIALTAATPSKPPGVH